MQLLSGMYAAKVLPPGKDIVKGGFQFWKGKLEIVFYELRWDHLLAEQDNICGFLQNNFYNKNGERQNQRRFESPQVIDEIKETDRVRRPCINWSGDVLMCYHKMIDTDEVFHVEPWEPGVA